MRYDKSNDDDDKLCESTELSHLRSPPCQPPLVILHNHDDDEEDAFDGDDGDDKHGCTVELGVLKNQVKWSVTS